MKSQLTDGDSETENGFWRKDGRIEANTLKARKENNEARKKLQKLDLVVRFEEKKGE